MAAELMHRWPHVVGHPSALLAMQGISGNSCRVRLVLTGHQADGGEVDKDVFELMGTPAPAVLRDALVCGRRRRHAVQGVLHQRQVGSIQLQDRQRLDLTTPVE